MDRRVFLQRGTLALGALALPDLGRLYAARPAQGEPLDYVKVGRATFERWGVDPTAAPLEAIYELTAKSCLSFAFGPVLLQLPKEAFRSEEARQPRYPQALPLLRLTVPAVLRGMSKLAEWAEVDDFEPFTEKDLEALGKGLELPEDYDPSGVDAPLSLRGFVGEKPKKKIVDLLDRVDALLACPLYAEGGSMASSPVPVAVLPTRREMVEMACAAGVAEPNLASAFHIPAVTGWVHSYYGSPSQQGRLHLLCLEEGTVGDGAISQWQVPTGPVEPDLAEHSLTFDIIVGLLSNWNAKVGNWFALGLGFVGVMECYDGLSGRVGADSAADVTPPRSAFIPGGNSNGGAFVPNASDLRAVLKQRDFERMVERRKQAAYDLLEDRDSDDPQRKAAKAGDEVVFFNLRDGDGSEAKGYLHYGSWVGTDVSHVAALGVGNDLARVQRAVFTLVALELVQHEKGESLAGLLAVTDPAADFDEQFVEKVGITPAELEREVFAEIKKK